MDLVLNNLQRLICHKTKPTFISVAVRLNITHQFRMAKLKIKQERFCNEDYKARFK